MGVRQRQVDYAVETPESPSEPRSALGSTRRPEGLSSFRSTSSVPVELAQAVQPASQRLAIALVVMTLGALVANHHNLAHADPFL